MKNNRGNKREQKLAEIYYFLDELEDCKEFKKDE